MKQRPHSNTDILIVLIRGFLIFAKYAVGVIQTPYTTCRTLSKGRYPAQLLPIGLLVLSYIAWSSLAHHGIRAHPLLLTFSFGKIAIAVVGAYILIITVMFIVGRAIGGTGRVKSVLFIWSYSLLPTLVWFYSTSLLWFLFPPPRTVSAGGQALSFTLIVFSLYLFFWKGVLYYLTLRFGLRLGLWKIFAVSFVVIPMAFFYSLLMYRLGIFRIPFI
jgi:hypothetical protein